MPLQVIITALLILVAVITIIEYFKRVRRQGTSINKEAEEGDDEVQLSANEALPTQTGRFRVKQMLKTPKKEKRPLRKKHWHLRQK